VLKGLSALIVELAAGADGALPSELRLFRAGKNESLKGDFLFDEKAAKSVSASAARRGVRFPFDYNHGSTSALGQLNPEMSGKAAGWCSLSVKDGELRATDEKWTEAAATAIKAKEWAYISPTFKHDSGNRVTEMLCIALTNTPALHNLEPLIAASAALAAEDHRMEQLLKMLGATDEAAAIVALTALNAKIAQLTADKDAAQAKSVELATKVSTLEAAAEVAQLNALIEKGTASGQIAPAMVDVLRPLGVAGLTAFLEKAPKVIEPGKETKEKKEETGIAGLSAVELENCKKLGVDPTKFAEHKAKLKPAAA